MAHDGIDNIPKEGTWLLDKGERVVDSRTNADLKDYLAEGGGSGGDVNITVHVTDSGVSTQSSQNEQKQLGQMIGNACSALSFAKNNAKGVCYLNEQPQIYTLPRLREQLARVSIQHALKQIW